MENKVVQTLIVEEWSVILEHNKKEKKTFVMGWREY